MNQSFRRALISTVFVTVTIVACTSLIPEAAVGQQTPNLWFSPSLLVPKTPDAQVKAFIETYFATWSNKDIDGYAAHFHKDAVIMFVDNGRVQRTDRLEDFIQGQSSYLSSVQESVSERATSSKVDYDGRTGVITAEWVLEKGKRTTTGVNRFTLFRDESGTLKILTLVWSVNR